MNRIVNFRAPLFIAIGLILGIFSFYEFLFNDFWFGLVTLVVLLAIGVLLFAFKSKTWLGMIAVIVAVLIGFFLSYLNYHILNKDEAIERNVLITGRVCDVNRNGTDSSAYYLEACEDSDGIKYAGRIYTHIFDGAYSTGDVVTIRGVLYSTYPVKSQVEAYNLRQNVRYEMDTERVVLRVDGKMKLDETVRKYIYDTCEQYAPQNGDVLYALLTGDRSAMAPEKVGYFKSAGIIHLLAVSGLHVGFVAAALGLVLKRFKLHPLIECAIMLVPLIFYAYICSFTPSVIRAIVMLTCTYLARALFGKYDLLTSLSCAITIILIIAPFDLFDLGFQLSALSVYGIATLYLPVNRFLYGRKLPSFVRYLVNSLTVSVSCSVATFFTLQLNYGSAPVLGILLNLAVIPLVTVVFVIGWVGMLPWIFNYVLFVADVVLEAVVTMARWVAELSFASVSVPAVAVATVVVVLWLFVAGGYVNLRKTGKIVAHSALAVVLALCVGLSFIKTKPQNQAFVTFGYGDTMCAVTSTNGEAALIGNFDDYYAYFSAIEYLGKYKVDNCVLYVTDYDASDLTIVGDAVNRLPVKSVYKLDFAYNSQLDDLFADCGINVIQQMENATTGNSVTVTSVYDGGLRAVIARTGELDVTTVYGNEFAVANYLKLGVYSDVYALPAANKAYSDGNLTTLSLYQSSLPYNYGANKYGNFTITQKDDTIVINFR